MPADGLLAGAAGVEAAAAAGAAGGAGLLVEAAAGDAAEADGSTTGTATEAVDPTGGLREGGVTGAEDTTMAGTLLESAEETTGDASISKNIDVAEDLSYKQFKDTFTAGRRFYHQNMFTSNMNCIYIK